MLNNVQWQTEDESFPGDGGERRERWLWKLSGWYVFTLLIVSKFANVYSLVQHIVWKLYFKKKLLAKQDI